MVPDLVGAGVRVLRVLLGVGLLEVIRVQLHVGDSPRLPFCVFLHDVGFLLAIIYSDTEVLWILLDLDILVFIEMVFI